MSAADYLFALQSKVRRANGSHDLADALGDLAFTQMRMGYVADADITLAKLAQISTDENNVEISALHAHLLGSFDVYAGRTTASLTRLLTAQHLAQLAGSVRIEARTQALLCLSLSIMGAFGEASDAGDRALELAALSNDDRALCTACIALTNFYVDRGDAANAMLQIAKAAPALLRLGDPLTILSANITNLAALLLNARRLSRETLGDATCAVAAQIALQACLQGCKDAVAATENARHLKGLSHARISLSHAHQIAGDTQSALEEIDRAIAVCKSANAMDKLAPAYQAKASFLMHLNRDEEALQVLKVALDAAISADYLLVHEEIAALQVSCCEKLGDIAGAFAAAKTHTQILLKQRLTERTNLAALRHAKAAFNAAQVQLNVAHEQAAVMRVEQQQLIASTKTYEQFSFEDALTGLKNRRYFDAQFPHLLLKHAATQNPFCIAVIDIDTFKNSNDKFGHVAGDTVLKEVARCLRNAATNALAASEESTAVCRLGGDEFVMFMTEMALPAAAAICETVRQQIAASTTRLNYGATVSIGIAQWDGVETHTQLLTRADQKLFAAKHGGRNQIAG